MVSMSPRWASEKLSAETASGAPQSANASRAGTSRRNDGIDKSSDEAGFLLRGSTPARLLYSLLLYSEWPPSARARCPSGSVVVVHELIFEHDNFRESRRPPIGSL